MYKTIGLVSLGCVKNLVDSEIILASFVNAGFEISVSPKDSDVIVINTCAFIEDARKEAIDTIFEMASYKKKLIVVGCFAERYKENIKTLLPEVDLFIPISEYSNLGKIIKDYLELNIVPEFNPLNRILSTPSYTAYLRISEGCDNCCSYCAIPLIRGHYKSRPLEEILIEAKEIGEAGIKELNIIGQDISCYGKDLVNTSLVTLLKEIESLNLFESIRLLYLYPSEITDEFIEYVANSKIVEHYFDIPFQHASNKILKAMNRHATKEQALEIVNKIKTRIPDAIFRTTYIVGFPGETNDDFLELLEFNSNIGFHHVGAFTFSKEEGTGAYKLKDDVSKRLKKDRYFTLMEQQKRIAYSKNKELVGRICNAICINYDEKAKTAYFRCFYNAPDDIDGNVFSNKQYNYEIGKTYKIKITSAFVYDLMCEIIE